MNQISPLAYVHPEAKLGDNNIIGPFCFIDRNTVMGDNNVLQNSVTINYGARIGNGNEIFPGHRILSSKARTPSAKLATITLSVRMLLSLVVLLRKERHRLATTTCSWRTCTLPTTVSSVPTLSSVTLQSLAERYMSTTMPLSLPRCSVISSAALEAT